MAFGDDALAGGSLKLNGVRKQSVQGFLDQATPFYDNLVAGPAMKARMAKFGYPEARLVAEQKLVADLRQAVNVQLMESGEAQASTLTRDKALDALDAWASDFKAICKVALADDPQRMEQLGVLVLNQARRKAKTKVTA